MQELHNALRLLAYHLFSLRVYCIELLYTTTPSSANFCAHPLGILGNETVRLPNCIFHNTKLRDSSSVHSSVSPSTPPMNLKRWTVQSERLFSSHHLGQSLQLANKKQSFHCLPRRALLTCALVQASSRFRVFFCSLSSKKYCTGAFYGYCWACSQAVPFTNLSKLCKHAGQNHFAEPNWHVFDFSASIQFAGSHTQLWCSCSYIYILVGARALRTL